MVFLSVPSYTSLHLLFQQNWLKVLNVLLTLKKNNKKNEREREREKLAIRYPQKLR